jgi:hypothetical protein
MSLTFSGSATATGRSFIQAPHQPYDDHGSTAKG